MDTTDTNGLKNKEGFTYNQYNGGEEVILLLHGLFGATGNFQSVNDYFGKSYNVVTPILPIMEMPIKKLGLKGLCDYVESFVEMMGFDKMHVVGNSLGGHIAQLYALKRPENIKSLVLTASSGLFENSFGSTFPKRGNYEFVKTKTQSTFYDPEVATKALVDEVFDTVNDRSKAIRIVITAKSAVRNNLEKLITSIVAPTLLIWGKNDTITPDFVGQRFQELIPNSELVLLDECGHAPMMEKPEEFNSTMETFLNKL